MNRLYSFKIYFAEKEINKKTVNKQKGENHQSETLLLLFIIFKLTSSMRYIIFGSQNPAYTLQELQLLRVDMRYRLMHGNRQRNGDLLFLPCLFRLQT